MHIIERGKVLLQGLREAATKTAWDWRQCPRCGDTVTCKHGTYGRAPWTLAGRQAVRVQRHWCYTCGRSYSETSAWLVRGSWYAREVHRATVAHWVPLGTSVRRTAEVLRSWLGRQERWCLWRPLDVGPDDRVACHRHASTVSRWLAAAGERAKATVPDQLAGVPSSGQTATDGLWVRLRRDTKRVVLLLVDHVTGVCWPPVVAPDETQAASWEALFVQAQQAGLDLVRGLRGIASDGATGLEAYRKRHLPWVSHQRCVFHLWRGLAGELARQVTAMTLGLTGAVATVARRQARRTLVALVRAVYNAPAWATAQTALGTLAAHPHGAVRAALVATHLHEAFVSQCGYTHGLGRASPEWLWRDFRARLSHGRNHGADPGLERAALVWAISHNFTPAQGRCARTRHYRHPGLCPLAVAGVPPGEVSYLDALGT